MATPAVTTLLGLARLTGLPAAWLKREATEGRIPCLRIGRQLRFNPEAVDAALAVMASQPSANQTTDKERKAVSQ